MTYKPKFYFTFFILLNNLNDTFFISSELLYFLFAGYWKSCSSWHLASSHSPYENNQCSYNLESCFPGNNLESWSLGYGFKSTMSRFRLYCGIRFCFQPYYCHFIMVSNQPLSVRPKYRRFEPQHVFL